MVELRKIKNAILPNRRRPKREPVFDNGKNRAETQSLKKWSGSASRQLKVLKKKKTQFPKWAQT